MLEEETEKREPMGGGGGRGQQEAYKKNLNSARAWAPGEREGGGGQRLQAGKLGRRNGKARLLSKLSLWLW